MKRIALYIATILELNNVNGQSFNNGDLDGGPVTWINILPTNWQNVPQNDINCLCSGLGSDTPDLVNLSQPWPNAGLNGNAFSGNTFISGLFSMDSQSNTFFQEGIMQNVSGLSIGDRYLIRFRQTVAKSSSALDFSGSWAVYIDSVLIGISAPSFSFLPFNSTSMIWDFRSLDFVAKSNSHLLKFLPLDDDSNHINSTTDTTGALYMGIDSIGLELLTNVDEVNTDNRISVFPNPSDGSFYVRTQIEENNSFFLTIYDSTGNVTLGDVALNSGLNKIDKMLANGLYTYSIVNNKNLISRGRLIVNSE
jgi:hypothetical protein